MPLKSKSKSKSNRREAKQRSQVKQQKRNWLDLPYDIMANILKRIGVFHILLDAQQVCTTWRNICMDPSMWRVINMDNFSVPDLWPETLKEICKQAVYISQGQLVDITIGEFADDELLEYVADRSSQLEKGKETNLA
ncbi:hypothetical protein L1887_14568 [Cichorium endivia]|nr:hypothetical protein L1887_14568 [Cichorium endivia]